MEKGDSRKAGMQGCGDSGAWLSTGLAPTLRGQGITSTSLEVSQSGGNKDGERVDIVLVGTSVGLGESAEEEEVEAEEEEDEEEVERSRPACMAEAEMFMLLPHNLCLERKRGRGNAFGRNIKKLVLCTM